MSDLPTTDDSKELPERTPGMSPEEWQNALDQQLFVATEQAVDLDWIRRLVEAGADVNSKRLKNGWTPLHWLCQAGRTAEIRYLIDQGADVHALTTKGSTPLYLAVIGGQADVCILLLHHGADPFLVKSPATGSVNALQQAIDESSIKCCIIFLEHGVSASIRNDHGLNAVEQAEEAGWIAGASAISAWLARKAAIDLLNEMGREWGQARSKEPSNKRLGTS